MKTKLIVIWIGVMFLLSQFLFVEAEEYKNIRDLLPLTPLNSETQSQKLGVVKGGRLPGRPRFLRRPHDRFPYPSLVRRCVEGFRVGVHRTGQIHSPEVSQDQCNGWQ